MSALLEEFQQVGRDLYAAGLVSSHGGNLSVRQGEGLWQALQWTSVVEERAEVLRLLRALRQNT
jgi:ribulose-5-phosphate 4-epimerase/fuculose-1-phosphate aldolase